MWLLSLFFDITKHVIAHSDAIADSEASKTPDIIKHVIADSKASNYMQLYTFHAVVQYRF